MTAPPPAPPARRAAVLQTVLDPARLTSHPIVALRVVEAASRPNFRPADIVALLNQDPVLCAQILKAVNSCAYGLSRPVGSIDRAVIVVGVNKVRALALGLSLPAARPKPRPAPQARELALAAVGGAIVSRELAVRFNHPAPEDVLAAGLLRDIGAMLLQQAFPDAWAELASDPDPLEERRCDREREVFGIDHAELAAEVFATWKLPADLTEPVRYHHHPDRFVGGTRLQSDRADLLWFAGLLVKLDMLVDHPAELDAVMHVAAERFGMPRAELAEFMQHVWPKIEEYARLLSRDVGPCPDYAHILAAGSDELLRLAAAPGSHG